VLGRSAGKVDLEVHRREIGRRASGEERLFEILLPISAAVFVFASIPKQMKNFFVSGLLFLAIGLVRLQQDLWRDQGLWPVLLLACGLGLMMLAAQYTKVKLVLRRFRRS